jgi:bla regulator protein blaR1
MRHWYRAVLFVGLAAGLALAQTPASPKQFDVSTVKPNSTDDRRVLLSLQPGGRFVSTGTTLKLLMTEAYGVRDFQIFGGPGWLNTDRWDIVAKAEDVADRIPIEQFRPMLRVLIEDRFQLKVHREMKEMPAYVLLVGKSGSKLQANSGGPGPMLRMGRGELTGKKASMAMVLQVLSQQLGRPLIDKTGLTGEYDFTLQWTPEPGQGGFAGGPPGGPPGAGPEPPPPAADGPSIFTAIQEQLGLRLDSQKVPVETIVIDSVEKPSEN